jgi:hypothetical protein
VGRTFRGLEFIRQASSVHFPVLYSGGTNRDCGGKFHREVSLRETASDSRRQASAPTGGLKRLFGGCGLATDGTPYHGMHQPTMRVKYKVVAQY